MGLQESTRHLLATELESLTSPERVKRLLLALVRQRMTLEDHAAQLEVERNATGTRLERLRDDIRAWTEQAAQAVAEDRDELARVALKKVAEHEQTRSAAEARLDAAELELEQTSAAIDRLNTRAREAMARLRTLNVPAEGMRR